MREEGLNGDSYSKPVVNLLSNPSSETANASTTLATNALVNPKADGVTAGTTYIRTNLCTNPSSETTNAFNGAGTGTVTSVGLSSTQAYVGTQSTKFVLPTNAGNAEGWKSPAFTVSPSTTYTISFYVYVESGSFPVGQVSGSDYATNSVVLNGTPVIGAWTRLSLTYTTLSTQTTLMPWGITTLAGVYYLDAILLEQTDQLRPYFDGTGSGPLPSNGWVYAWTGTAHASTSTAKCAAITVRTNLASDPAATTYKTDQPTLGWENTRWPGYSTYSSVSGASDGPIAQLKTYNRITCSNANTSGLGWNLVQNVELATLDTTKGYPLSWATGTYVTLSAWVRSSSGTGFAMIVRFADSSGNFLASATQGTIVGSGSSNVWNRAFVTATVPAGSAYMAANFEQRGTVNNQVGDTFDATGLLAEINVASAGDYFDGTFLNGSDFTYSWTGTANASSSLCYAPSPANWTLNQQYPYAQYYQHTNTDSSHSIRLRMPANMPAGGWRILQGNIANPTSFINGAYTTFVLKESSSWAGNYFSSGVTIAEGSAQNGIGASVVGQSSPTPATFTYSLVNTATASAASIFYRTLPISTISTTTELYFDFYQGAIIPAAYTGSYFDGSTITASEITYAWTGSANLSSSIMKGTTVSGMSSYHTIAIQSSEWAVSGAKSLRVVTIDSTTDTFARIDLWTNNYVQQGKTYTLIATLRQAAVLAGAAAGASQDRNIFIDINGGGGSLRGLATSPPQTNAAGVYQHKVVFTVPPITAGTVTSLTARFYNGHAAGNGDVWWDNIMLTEGVYNGPYIDGDQPGITWSGTAHASSSKGYPLSPLLIKNTFPNAIPSASTGWVSENGTGGAVTNTYVTGGGPNNRNYQRTTWTTGATGGTIVGGATASTWSPGAFPPGQTISISIWARSTAAFVGYMTCYFYPGGTAIPLTGGNVTLVPGVWTRYSATVTIPYGISTAPYIQFRTSGGSLAVTGTTLDVTMAQVTVGSTLYDYVDPGYAYPPQLPKGAAVDTTATSTSQLSTNLGLTLAAPATTWYTAYQLNTNGTAGSVYPSIVYGDALNDTVANTYNTMRYNQVDATTGTWANRKTGGGGAYSGGGVAYAPGVHVLVHGVNSAGLQFIGVDGNALSIDYSSAMVHASTLYQIQATSIGVNLRTLGYAGDHSAAVKSQIITYLRNKYGA